MDSRILILHLILASEASTGPSLLAILVLATKTV
jgi:hypothetical protein